jgi:hypothetical protein
MNFFSHSSATPFPFFPNSKASVKYVASTFPLMAMAAALLLIASPAQAGNLLVNPGFETPPSGHATYGTTVATGWTYFSPPVPVGYFGDYWVQPGTAHGVPTHSGSCFWNEWGALYNTAVSNVAGIYQTFSSAPGSTYQASGWMTSASLDGGGLGPDCSTWMQVEFLDANTNLLALYKSPSYTASLGFDTWLFFSVTNACDLTQPVSTGDPYFTTYAETGTVSQIVSPLGTVSVRFRYCYFQAGNEGGSADLDDTALNQISGPIPPVISSLFPQNMILVNPSNNISFNVTSPSGFTINNSGIGMTVNGVNVAGSLAISGTSSGKNVSYIGLQSNSTYTVSITVTDALNLTVNASTYFETTWYGIQPVTYSWEAEDWDFTNGMFIDNPDLCNAPGDPGCYFGKVGVQGVDENNTSGASGPYRPGDLEGTAPSGDLLRPNLYAADRVDYCINPFVYGEWVNYTRDWADSTNWIIGRLATGAGSGSETLSEVTPTTTNVLGTFTINTGLGWTTFEYVYLKDTNGNNANVVLNGQATLRLTCFPGGNLLPNFFMLVAAEPDLPIVSGMYPTGMRPFEQTNTLSFTATTLGSTFPANSIKVNLDGIDVSSSLVITGSGSTKNVVYPSLLLNAVHTAIITVTNVLGHGISVTNQFDTFTQNNFMFEAEDFDYNGGQYISPVDWAPDAYAGLDASPGIDFEHSTIAGELYPYRNGIPQSLVQNYVVEARQEFVNAGASDYQLDWFGIGDWANYTDVYPTGSFFVYVRTAGLSGIPFSMYLSEVVSGAGTTNQVLKPLGQFSSVGINQQSYTWVQLTDAGLVAPAVLKLGGVSTLQMTTTTGDCYPNYFMLVPAAGINLSATASGGNIGISFPTQVGATYRVFYRTNLTTGNWIYLATTLGNGTKVTVIDNPTARGLRFYKVTSP